ARIALGAVGLLRRIRLVASLLFGTRLLFTLGLIRILRLVGILFTGSVVVVVLRIVWIIRLRRAVCRAVRLRGLDLIAGFSLTARVVMVSIVLRRLPLVVVISLGLIVLGITRGGLRRRLVGRLLVLPLRAIPFFGIVISIRRFVGLWSRVIADLIAVLRNL